MRHHPALAEPAATPAAIAFSGPHDRSAQDTKGQSRHLEAPHASTLPETTMTETTTMMAMMQVERRRRPSAEDNGSLLSDPASTGVEPGLDEPQEESSARMAGTVRQVGCGEQTANPQIGSGLKDSLPFSPSSVSATLPAGAAMTSTSGSSSSSVLGNGGRVSGRATPAVAVCRLFLSPWMSVLLLVLALLTVAPPVGALSSGGAGGPASNGLAAAAATPQRSRWNRELDCPKECECKDRSRKVDCTFRGLNYVPRAISRDVKRLDLQGNNLTVLRRTDFSGLTGLHTLHLQHNQIHTIEKGTFDDLTEMVRIRVDRNQLESIPDGLFARMTKLERIDLSYNLLQNIGRKTLKSSDILKNV